MEIEVLAYDDGRQLRVRCPFCKLEHRHGRGGVAAEVADGADRRAGLGPPLGKSDLYGGRGSHCVTGGGGDYTLIRPPEGEAVDLKPWPKRLKK